MRGFYLILFCFCTVFSFGQLRRGHYYDLDGNKVEGKFKMKGNYFGAGSKLIFYTKEGEKRKLKPDKIQSAVLGVDSFAIITFFSAGDFSYFDADFGLVRNTGAINMYLHRSKRIASNSGGGVNTYPSFETREVFVINLSGTKKNYGIAKLSDFKKYFLPMIEDNMELTNKILNTKSRFWMESLPAFVQEYNDFKANR